MSIDVEKWSHFNLWKCPRDRINYRGCTMLRPCILSPWAVLLIFVV